MHDPILEHVKAISAEMGRAKLREEFKTIDRRLLSKMSDNELAIWQSQYPSDSPHFLLSEHEWQRRLTIEQVKASRFAALIGLLGTVVGTVVGSFITWLVSK
jgi:hypothetical protein